MTLELELDIILVGESRIINSLIESIKPDNLLAPENISVNEEVSDGTGLITIKLKVKDPKDILRFRNTVDDILEHLIIGLKVLKSVKDN